MEMTGAAVETGIVRKVTVGGAEVESITRPGVMTPPLPKLKNETLSAGDRVYFFLFDNGTGMIISRIPA